MGEKLTKSDVAKIRQEIEHRRIVVRREKLEAVKVARAHGDLSENFEYHAAKKEKNANESRIRYLERMLRTATVIDDSSKSDEIGINNSVEVFFEDEEESETYRIVTSIRGNSMNGLVSIDSPIGKALLGRKKGDRVYVKVRDDFGYYLQVRNISKDHSDEEDKLRVY